MNLSKEIEIIRYSNKKYEATKDNVINEFTLKILINSKPFVNLICSPKSLDALVVGFLFSEEIISCFSDIEKLEINLSMGIAFVELVNKDILSLDCYGTNAIRTITTACGKMHFISYPVTNYIENIINSDITFKCKDILERVNDFNRESELFRKTGGVHSCSLCYNSISIYFEEDIGRHNAIDKVIGKALTDCVDFSKFYIITSGRVPVDLIRKISRCGIPLVISRSAPTDKAIELAIEKNITLIGFARGERMNIYSGADRLEMD